jgi:dTDP-4-dehydrorhamnose 3,5-epimerase
MIFTETGLPGSYLVEFEPICDERGFLARLWTEPEFRAKGLDPSCRQALLSYNRRKGTLRGMHYQVDEFQEAKLVRCIAGAIFDVMIDLRRDSPTFTRHFGVVLTAGERSMLYVPEGFAHGFQTLTNDTEVFYLVSQVYSPDHARGVRWNDPVFAIDWPLPPQALSDRDQGFPDFLPETGGL